MIICFIDMRLLMKTYGAITPIQTNTKTLSVKPPSCQPVRWVILLIPTLKAQTLRGLLWLSSVDLFGKYIPSYKSRNILTFTF